MLVAFSGGVDSGVLLAAAAPCAGPRPGRRRDRGVAEPAGGRNGTRRRLSGPPWACRHESPRTDELARAGDRANAGDRCAFCKTELADVLSAAGGPPRHRRRRHRDQRRRPAGRLPARGSAPPPDAWRLGAARPRRYDQGRRPRRRPAMGAAACRQAGRGLPRQPDRLRSPVTAEVLARVESAEAGLRTPWGGGLAVRNLRVATSAATPRGWRSTATRVPEVAARPEPLAAVAGLRAGRAGPRGFRPRHERAAAGPRPLPLSGLGDPRCGHAGAEAVVDVDHQHAGRAGGEHRQQRGEPLEGGAVADGGRDGDDQPVGQPRDDARAARRPSPRRRRSRRRWPDRGRRRARGAPPRRRRRPPAGSATPLAASVAATSAATGPSDVPAVSTSTAHRRREGPHERAPGLGIDDRIGPALEHGHRGRVVDARGPGEPVPRPRRRRGARPGTRPSAPGSCRRRRPPRACRCAPPGRGPAGRSRDRRCAAHSPVQRAPWRD